MLTDTQIQIVAAITLILMWIVIAWLLHKERNDHGGRDEK
jgi:hypothetical protein